MLRAAGLLLFGVLGGCAYYNGLWRANRFAAEASRAEAEGRVGEARSLWAQAAVRAESVTVRHPSSRWTDDALLLQGRALIKLGQCRQALDPLGRALAASSDVAMREEAALLAAACWLEQGDAVRARALSTAVVGSGDSERVSRARYWRGLAAQAEGDHRAAAEDLAASRLAGAGVARAVSLVSLSDFQAARPILDSLLQAGASDASWTRLATALGDADPGEASRVLSTLTDHAASLPPEGRARLLLVAARRSWARGDTTAAETWLKRASEVAPDSVAGREAELALLALAIARAGAVSELGPLVERLKVVTAQGGAPGRDAARLAALGEQVASPAADAGTLLLRAELARDSLKARRLAARLCLEVASRWPESLFAPKALLGAASVEPALADSVAAVLAARYPGSPYVLALAGRATPAYSLLEDSLLALSGVGRSGRAAPADGRRPPVETGPRSVPLPEEVRVGRRGTPR